MFLTHIQINNFRNISSTYLKLSEGLNLFWGDNAQGKTNLLEAIFYLVTGRSFRAKIDKECISWNTEKDQYTIIRGEVVRSSGPLDLLIAFTSSNKKVLINEKPIDRLGLLWGNVNAVLFTPNDLLLMKGAPQLRRRMMDIEFSQINTSYLRYLQRFNEALKQRNAILRMDNPMSQLITTLEAWDEQIVSAAVEILILRQKYLLEIEKYAAQCYQYITDNNESLTIEYDNFLRLDKGFEPNPDVLKRSYLELLEDKREEDFYRNVTNYGPHHDDWLCKINDYDIRTYGSQGQQRSAILSIRLAEIDLMKNNVGETPILLLDDIISEIDETRQKKFFEYLNRPLQTIITSTSPEKITHHTGVKKLFHINKGNFVEE